MLNADKSPDRVHAPDRRRLRRAICVVPGWPTMKALLACVAALGMASAAIDPGKHRVVLENDYVRVLELRAGAGESVAVLSRARRVGVALSDARVRLSGKILDRKPGDVWWSDAGDESYEVVAGTLHCFEIEVKEASPTIPEFTAPDVRHVTPHLARIVLENDYVRIVDIRGDAGQKFDWHSHPPMVGVRLGAGRSKVVNRDGSARLSDRHPGEVTWTGGSEHWDVVLFGILHNLMIEIKPRRP
jgi:hypothetical protein